MKTIKSILREELNEIIKPVATGGGDDYSDYNLQTAFNLILVNAGNNLNEIIKLLRSIPDISIDGNSPPFRKYIGLYDTKKIIQNLPRIIKFGININEAEKLKSLFEQLGATVEIK